MISAISVDMGLAVAPIITREVAAGEVAAEAVVPDVEEVAVATVVAKVTSLRVCLSGAKCSIYRERISGFISPLTRVDGFLSDMTQNMVCFEVNPQNMVYFRRVNFKQV